MHSYAPYLRFSDEVSDALAQKKPIVALESTIIAHGMPYPQNIETARQLEATVRQEGAIPATIALMKGQVVVGLSDSELEQLASAAEVHKVSRRDFARVLSQKALGATTVAGTLIACRMAGIRVFATGGIGGVHRGVPDSWDISADLTELSQAPVLCVCAGAKAILDIPKTLEALETLGVPVMTYQSEQFPAFYWSKSGVDSPCSMPDLESVASMLNIHWRLGLESGALLAVPIPQEYDQDPARFNDLIDKALSELRSQNIVGKHVTPFLLKSLVEFSDGASLAANIALVKNNTMVAAKIAGLVEKGGGV